ncbi:hypothetical protein QCA50_006335 [Cerrena zonata]|uniref:DUF6593 domain-containing protein n=1 Tax=Cerrena zonata TaxID=2478898 RepID=A0AAW0GHH2_9APHY
MRLLMTTGTLMNTIITDSHNRPLYSISTSTGTFKAGPTKVYSMGNNSSEVATINWRTYRKTKVYYRGTEMNMKTWMPKKGFWSGKRVMTGPDGTGYMWKKRWGKPADLIRLPNKGAVKSRRGKKRIMRITKPFMSSNTYIEIDRDGEYMLELIIVSAAFMERERLGGNAGAPSGGELEQVANSLSGAAQAWGSN